MREESVEGKMAMGRGMCCGMEVWRFVIEAYSPANIAESEEPVAI